MQRQTLTIDCNSQARQPPPKTGQDHAILTCTRQNECGETAIVLLRPQKPTDQYAFLTAAGLGFLHYVETRHYDE